LCFDFGATQGATVRRGGSFTCLREKPGGRTVSFVQVEITEAGRRELAEVLLAAR